MSRPKRCAYEASAKGKIESAFWTVLENEGFNSVTMLRISQEAGLNRNTVYYHFNNVQEVALGAFKNSFTDDASALFISTILAGNSIASSGLKDSEVLSHIKKIHLFAKSESPMLVSIVKDFFKKAWFANVGISEEMLTEFDKIQIEYIINGFIGIIGNSKNINDFFMLKTFPGTLIGRAAVNTLKEIASKQQPI